MPTYLVMYQNRYGVPERMVLADEFTDAETLADRYCQESTDDLDTILILRINPDQSLDLVSII